MFHPYRKDSSYLRTAIYRSYKEKCAYCGRTIQEHDMHIDHIIPSNQRVFPDDEVREYITELNEKGFIADSIENYLPSCPACNISKSNQFFTASNLRFFHEKARVHVEEILKIMDGLKDAKETFYEPVDKGIWEEIDFSYQRDLSHAIMGYRLTPADVNVCPRFPQVDKIRKQLSIVDYTVVEGETGCGKSISIYQAAYDFYQDGWKVYQCKATEEIDATSIKGNTELSLYIIDDAQQLSEKIVDALKRQARPNAKILLARTTSSVIKQDTILLTNREAVELIYTNFIGKKEEIIPIVHKHDKRIGVNFLEQPIEWRLKAAKEAITPWQFNYILRGGWQNMKDQYQTVCSHKDCDLLTAAIAVFQILKLDHSVDFNWICKGLGDFDNSLTWDEADLRYLVEKMIVLSEDDVRVVHMESAKIIIALFFKDSQESKRQLLLRFIEKNFMEKSFSPLGLVWLCNGVRSHDFTNESFITEKMIVSALEEIGNINSSEERRNITYFTEKVFNLRYEKNGKYYFEKHNKVFLGWIQNADSKTAYAYSNLMNTLINTDIEQHRKFVQEINWTSLQEAMRRESKPDLYCWGELYNRLTHSLSKEEYLPVGQMLETVIGKFCETASSLTIKDLTCFLCSVMHMNQDYIHDKIEKLIPVYAGYFKKDMLRAIYLFDFDFFGYVCGMNLLGGHRASSNEKKSAKLIVSAIPEKEFAETIIKCQPRDWHTIHPIMHLIARYNREKAKRIVELVDRNRLTEKAKDSWEQCREITELCDILYTGSSKIAEEFIEDNLDKIQIMYSSFVMITPRCAIEAFDRGIKIDLLTEHQWGINFLALKKLNELDATKAKEILLKSEPEIVKRINSVTALDFDEGYCLEFLKLVQSIDAEIFEMIAAGLDMAEIQRNWNRGVIHKGKEKQVEKRRKQFYELIKC